MDPVRLFLRRLSERIDETVAAKVETLTSGTGVTEISNYREMVGYIRGLRDVIAWCDEVYTDLMRPDSDQPNPNRAVPQRVADRMRRVPRYEGQ